MSLQAALSIGASGLANITRQLALVSHNVANANTPGYVAETGNQQSLTVNDQELGVITGPATRNLDVNLQAQVLQQGSTVSEWQTRQTALQSIDAVLGTPGQGTDLASLLGDVQNQFSSLQNNPASPAQQATVVASAGRLAQAINTLSQAYAAQRQTAQNNIVSAVGTINTTLASIGQLSDRIATLKAAGQSTADLESQRDAAVQTLAQIVDIRTLVQPNGDMLVTTTGGLALPTHGLANQLATSSANLQSATFYPGGGVPAITLGGSDVTAQLTGGQIGGNITLRDVTLPTDQAGLDEFAQNLASRFDAQGLTLFTDPTGAVPAGGGVPVQSAYIGFASIIQVNPAVQADPSLVRDGTTAIGGSPTGASAFTPNPPGGPAGFTTLISRVLSYALGAEVQSGVPQPASNTSGLGPAGNLNAPYAAPATLGGLAATLVAAQAQDSANTTTRLSTEQAVQTTLSNSLDAGSSVKIDGQMSLMIALQNAYGANAKVLAAVQAMWTQLINSVQ